MKSRMTLSINRRGYPALLYFALIALISMSKFDAVFLDLCKSPEEVFHLYLFGILETQGTAFLFSFRYICVVTTPSLFKRFLCVKTFQDLLLYLTLCLGENYLKLQIRHLVETYSFCCIYRQQIVYRMEGSMVLLLHFQFLPCACQLILLIKDHPLHSHLFVCKNFD